MFEFKRNRDADSSATLYVKNNNIMLNDNRMNLNGNNYVRETDFKGVASMNINLGPGTYSVVTSCDNTSVNSTVTIKSTIEANDLVKLYQNGTQFYVKFLNVMEKH